MTTQAQIKATAKYDRKHTTGLYLKLNKTTDADIIDLLAQQENKQGFIKELLRDYLKKGK